MALHWEVNYAQIHNSHDENPLQVYDVVQKPALYVTTLHLKPSYKEQQVMTSQSLDHSPATTFQVKSFAILLKSFQKRTPWGTNVLPASTLF
jgi:hypothetical protein